MKFQIIRSFKENYEQYNIRIAVDSQNNYYFVWDDFVKVVTVDFSDIRLHSLLMEKKRKMEDLKDLIDYYGRTMVDVNKFYEILASVPDRKVKKFGRWLNKTVANCKNKILEERYDWESNDNVKSEKEIDWGILKRIGNWLLNGTTLLANLITILSGVKRWLILVPLLFVPFDYLHRLIS